MAFIVVFKDRNLKPQLVGDEKAYEVAQCIDGKQTSAEIAGVVYSANEFARVAEQEAYDKATNLNWGGPSQPEEYYENNATPEQIQYQYLVQAMLMAGVHLKRAAESGEQAKPRMYKYVRGNLKKLKPAHRKLIYGYPGNKWTPAGKELFKEPVSEYPDYEQPKEAEAKQVKEPPEDFSHLIDVMEEIDHEEKAAAKTEKVHSGNGAGPVRGVHAPGAKPSRLAEIRGKDAGQGGPAGPVQQASKGVEGGQK